MKLKYGNIPKGRYGSPDGIVNVCLNGRYAKISKKLFTAELVMGQIYPRMEKIKSVPSLDSQGMIDVWYVDGEYVRTYINEEFSVSGKEKVLIQRNGETSSVSLEQLYYLFREEHEQLKVLSLNKEILSWEWKPLRNVIKHKTVDPLVVVKTRCGREMMVSRSHSCLTVDGDGNIVKIAPKDMEIGRTFLPVMRDRKSVV